MLLADQTRDGNDGEGRDEEFDGRTDALHVLEHEGDGHEQEHPAPQPSDRLHRHVQLWTWFGGMLVVTLPWHLVGVMGQPRRMAYYDFTDPALAPQAIWVSVSAVGGFILVFSAILLVGVLIASHRGQSVAVPPLKFSLAVNPPRRLPRSLNSLGVWTLLMVALTVANYGYPLAQFLFFNNASVLTYSRQIR